jgi:hypothetical protein
MVADPSALPVTDPLAETDATPALPLDHETLTLNAVPLASRGVAVSCVAWPSDNVTELGFTDTEATTGAATVTAAVPLCPPADAVIVADPRATAVTRPLDETEATPPLDVDQETEMPLRVAPEASLRVAVNCLVPPG